MNNNIKEAENRAEASATTVMVDDSKRVLRVILAHLGDGDTEAAKQIIKKQLAAIDG